MRLIGLAVVLMVGVLLAHLVSDAEQPGRVYQVGILWNQAESRIPPFFSVFGTALSDSGYSEGKNLSFVHRWAGNRGDRFPVLANELVRLKVDVLFAISTPAIQAAAEATTTIPIVVISVGDPVAAGLITSLARPGGNLTGLSARALDLNVKLLELLKESAPRASRIAVIGGTAVAPSRNEMEAAAHSLKVKLQFLELPLGTLHELEATIETAARARAEGLVLLPTVVVAANARRVAELALQRGLPAIFWQSEFAEVGGLMGYGPDYFYLWQRAGALVGRILKGAKPADLPVEQADRFRFVVNLKTAKALGLTIPPSLLLRADQVIE